MLHNFWVEGALGHVAEHNAIASRLYNVMDHGAVGNDVHDDTAAINSTIAKLRAQGGGLLYIPPGTYLVTSTLLVDLTGDPQVYGMLICGDGGRSKIHYSPIDGTDCLHILGSSAGMSTIHISDLSLVGAYNPGTGNAIHLQRCISPVLIESVNIGKFRGGSGILAESCWMTNIQSGWIQECKYGTTFTNDVTAGGWGSTVMPSIRNSHMQFNFEHGVYIPAAHDGGYTIAHLTLENCIIEGNVGGGIVANGLHNFQFRNIYFETNDPVVGDVRLNKCIFGAIENCGSHFPTHPYASLTLDSDCSNICLRNNNWQGDVAYNGAKIYDIFSSWTTSAATAVDHKSSNYAELLPANNAAPSLLHTWEPKFWLTNNTKPTIYTDLTDGFDGQDIVIRVGDIFTTFDFSGSSLKGNNGEDFAASSGDVIRAIHLGDYWYCQIIR